VHKRIAILTNVIQPYRLPLLEEMQRRCEKLAVFVSSEGDPVQDKTGTPPFSICRQKLWTVKTKWTHPHDFTEQLTIQIPYDTYSQLQKFRPDLIVSGELGARTLLATAYRRFYPSTRLVIWATLSEATEQGRGYIRPTLRRLMLRAADAIMVNGESGARYIARFGVPPDRIKRVPQAPNAQVFLAGGLARTDPTCHRLLYAGRLIELKGLQPFLRAVAEWATNHHNRRVEFWIAGDGPIRAALATFAAPPNLEIRMLGQVTYDRLPDIFQQCGILAFPSLADEWGMVVVEAMASGIPVLGSIHSQAVEELISHGETGWKFNPTVAQEVRGAIDEALNTSARALNDMGSLARQRVRNLTPAAMADQIEAALDYASADRT